MNKTLKQIRINALQCSEKDMASKLDLSLSDYREIENDRTIKLDHLSKLSQATGKSIDELVNGQTHEVNMENDTDDTGKHSDSLREIPSRKNEKRKELEEFIANKLQRIEDNENAQIEVLKKSESYHRGHLLI